ncbi:solute carrier family 15 member 4 isoform X1 [Octopus bimaculoides]|uniref:Major facilitator superfamily (MFS) profile domain-containing protein n=2 Tax=Octopus bimaculoides TaxID=37653 RepID=A0A0L8HTS7_OCTBM|nr:solute carrier family 15 member 4 isoform X1 [Octopus bimaculoides]|eukprot:XP_014769777.1 PREDICTED: solute carrier family 15 member 4-like [Octopus bimaculoides]
MKKSIKIIPLESEESPSEEKENRSNKIILLSVICILIMELCERLTYYSITANLVLFAKNRLKYDNSISSYIVQIFSGMSYVMPIIGGYISDSISGKFNTIYGSGLIYLCGTFLLPASAVDYQKWFGLTSDGLILDLDLTSRRVYFILALTLIAIGTGGIKANVAPFGAQQIDSLGPKMVQRFFNWFYWFINVGALIAYSCVALVQQNISFEIGYLIPFISMLFAMVALASGRSIYKHSYPTGSALSQSAKIIREGIKRHKLVKDQAKAMGKKISSLDGAKMDNGGSFDAETVEGVLSSLKVLPVFIAIIFYWAIYSQMSSTYFLQGTVMDISINGAPMPVAVLNVFNVVIILILIPILDFVYKYLQKIGKNPTPLQRIGFGLVLSALSVAVAGIVEIYRVKELRQHGGVVQILANKPYNASRVSIFAQIPQFALIGSSEVFTSVTGLEFAYSQAPETLKGLVMGIFLLTTGLGNFLSTAVIAIVDALTKNDPWLSNDDINSGHLEYLFFLLCGLMTVAFFIFLFISKIMKFNSEEKLKQKLARQNMELTADENKITEI